MAKHEMRNNHATSKKDTRHAPREYLDQVLHSFAMNREL